VKACCKKGISVYVVKIMELWKSTVTQGSCTGLLNKEKETRYIHVEVHVICKIYLSCLPIFFLKLISKITVGFSGQRIKIPRSTNFGGDLEWINGYPATCSLFIFEYLKFVFQTFKI
jgi:hypothetical protein